MKPLYAAYALAGICVAATLGFFAYIDIVPSALRFSTIGQTALIEAAADENSITNALATSTRGNQSAPAAFPAGIVSINFDDGWKTAYTTGFPILEAAQMPATFYIISGYFGKSAYMSVADMLALQAEGYEIGDHTETHPNLTKLAPAQMQDEIAGSIAALKADGVQSITTFAYPYGAFNAQTDAIVRASGYTAARTISNGTDSPRSDPYLLLSKEVTSKTSIAQVEAWINEAIARKEWLILVFHQLNPTLLPHDPYSWPTSDFQAIIDYLTANHVPVMTNAAVITRYFSSENQ